MKKSTVRIFAIVLAGLMILSLLPLAYARAEEFAFPEEMPEIPGFAWMGDHYVETEHIYGEIINEDFLVDASEPGDCVTPALYWRSCINRNPFTEELCGVTAEAAYNEALQRAANDLNTQKNSGIVKHTDAEWTEIWNRTAAEILSRYTFTSVPTGHTWVEIEYQPATCEQAGWETYQYCSVCGALSGYDEIPYLEPTGHRFVDGKCEICGAEDPDADTNLAVKDDAAYGSGEQGEELENGSEVIEEKKDETLSENKEPAGDVIVTPNEGEAVKRESGEIEQDEQNNDEPEDTPDDEQNEDEPKETPDDEQNEDESKETPDDEQNNDVEVYTGEVTVEQGGVTADVVESFTNAAWDYLGWNEENRASIQNITPYKEDGTELSNEEIPEEGVTFEMDIPEGFDPNTQEIEIYHCNKDGVWEKMQAEVQGNKIIVRNVRSFSPFARIVKRLDSGDFGIVVKFISEDTETFDASEFIVHFDGNNSTTGNMGDETIPAGGGALKPNAYKRDNYAFTGWNVKPDGGGKSIADKQKVSSDDFPDMTGKEITLFAQWVPITVTFKGNGATEGSMPNPQAITTTKTPLMSNAFSRTGYTYIGWDTDINGQGQHFFNNQPVSTEDIEAPITLYAQWKKNISIVYQRNGGDGYYAEPTKYPGDTVAIKTLEETGIPSKSGRTFIEWNTAPDGSGKKYIPGDPDPDYSEITLTETTAATINLYAQWGFEVTFDGDNPTEGTMEKNPVKAVENEDFEIPENPYKKTGYVFDGWKSSKDGGKIYRDGVVPAADMNGPFTLTANWDREYTITFNGSGGTKKEGEAEVTTSKQTILESEFAEAGEKGVALDPNPFTRDEYVFTGWSKNNDNNPTIEEDDTVKKTDFTDAQLPLYACWEKKVDVSFVANGGTGSMELQEIPSGVATALSANEFRRSQYLFNFWSNKEVYDETDPECIKYDDKEEVTLNLSDYPEGLTLYAQWIGPLTISDTTIGSNTTAYLNDTIEASITDIEDDSDVTYQWYAKETRTSASVMKLTDVGKTIVRTAIPKKGTTEFPYLYCVATKGDQETESNYILLKDPLADIKLKQDIIDVVDGKPVTSYAQPGQIQGVSKNLEYSTDNGSTWNPVTNVSDAGVMDVLKRGTYIFRAKGTSAVSDPVFVDRWFTLGYTHSNSTSTSTSSSGSTTTTSGNGTVQMLLNGKSMPTSATPTTSSPNVVKYSGATNMWLVREGADDVITMTIRPSSGSYGHWNLNGGSYHNVGAETTITVSPIDGPEHYNIIFNRSSTSPRTADESHLGLWAALCVSSMTGAAVILTETRKRRKSAK